MAARREKRTDAPHDPAGVIRALRACRDAMIDVERQIKPFGPVYRLAAAVIAAIDRLGDHITGVPDYFHIGGSAASPERLARDARLRARENGDIPWEP